MDVAQRNVTLRAIEQIPQLASLFARRRAQLAAEVGLTDAQWRILEGIATEHFMPSMFAKDEGNTPGAISKLIRQLLQKRLVRTSISKQDGRQRNYHLTAKGRETLDRLRTLREEAIQAIWSDLDPSALSDFVRFNELLIERLRAYVREQQ